VKSLNVGIVFVVYDEDEKKVTNPHEHLNPSELFLDVMKGKPLYLWMASIYSHNTYKSILFGLEAPIVLETCPYTHFPIPEHLPLYNTYTLCSYRVPNIKGISCFKA